jgi:hypothetical protein
MSGEAQRDAVTDPAWEQELRAGMEADGDVGSVEPELAVARLLRHAHAPAELGDATETAIWREIAGRLDEITPARVPWWRRGARPLTRPWIVAPVAAMAAAAVLFLVTRPQPSGSSGAGAPVHTASSGARELAAQLEQQFAVLAPGARASVADRVDDSRSDVRSSLLAKAAATPTGQGAP